MMLLRKVSVFGVILVRIFPHSDCIQSECRKIRTRGTSYADIFYAVVVVWSVKVVSGYQFSTCSWLTEISKFKILTGYLLSRVCFFPEFHHYLFFPLSFADQRVAARFIFARSKSMDLNDFLILSNALKYSIIT